MIPLSAHPAAKLRERQFPGRPNNSLLRAVRPDSGRSGITRSVLPGKEQATLPEMAGRTHRARDRTPGNRVTTPAAEGQPEVAGRGTAGRLAAAGCRAWLTAVFLWPRALDPGPGPDPAWRADPPGRARRRKRVRLAQPGGWKVRPMPASIAELALEAQTAAVISASSAQHGAQATAVAPAPGHTATNMWQQRSDSR